MKGSDYFLTVLSLCIDWCPRGTSQTTWRPVSCYQTNFVTRHLARKNILWVTCPKLSRAGCQGPETSGKKGRTLLGRICMFTAPRIKGPCSYHCWTEYYKSSLRIQNPLAAWPLWGNIKKAGDRNNQFPNDTLSNKAFSTLASSLLSLASSAMSGYFNTESRWKRSQAESLLTLPSLRVLLIGCWECWLLDSAIYEC